MKLLRHTSALRKQTAELIRASCLWHVYNVWGWAES